MLELLLALLCLGLIAQSAQALEHNSLGDKPVVNVEFNDDPLWQAPALYSLRVMGMGIVGLVGFDLHHEDPAFENFQRALESPRPRRDDDGALFNFVLHPLWGSETYLRARSNGMTAAESFAFSMSASVVWEYLIESWTEHPSSQDLLYTTGIGWMIGEGRHYLLQRLEPDQQIWADPLYSLLDHVGLNAKLDSNGDLMPIVGIGWRF